MTSPAKLAVAAYVAVVLAANVALMLLPPMTVAPGVLAPAGVLFAGLALSVRDLVQRYAGRRAVLGSIAAGVALSAACAALTHSPGRIVLGSALAFAASELADWRVFTALRSRFLAAVVASGVVGLLVDSLIFLPVAFGSLAFLPGQIIGKLWSVAAAVLVFAIARRVSA